MADCQIPQSVVLRKKKRSPRSRQPRRRRLLGGRRTRALPFPALRHGRCPLSSAASNRRAQPSKSASTIGLLRGRSKATQPDAWNAAVLERLHLIAGHATYRQVGARTSTHPESVRRYFTYGHPSVEFVAAFCRAYGVSADWMLNGIGTPGHLPFAETASRSNTKSS